ncbi:MAG: hypothetical protein R3C11_03590 [Planctomycetaceae bacterium]
MYSWRQFLSPRLILVLMAFALPCSFSLVVETSLIEKTESEKHSEECEEFLSVAEMHRFRKDRKHSLVTDVRLLESEMRRNPVQASLAAPLSGHRLQTGEMAPIRC